MERSASIDISAIDLGLLIWDKVNDTFEEVDCVDDVGVGHRVEQ